MSFNTRKINSNTSVQYATVKTIPLTDAFDTESKIHNIFGGRSLNVNERLKYRISDTFSLIARVGYFSRTSNRSNYDDHYHDYNGGLKTFMEISPEQTFELSYSYDQYDKSRYIGGERTHDHDYSNRQHIVHGLYTKAFGEHCLTAGADWMHDYLTSYQFTDNAAHAQTSLDAFMQFDYNPSAWFNVVASVRDDWFSASGNNSVTGRLATMFKLRPVSIRASYAGGFRAPTLKEMYMCFDMAGIQMIYGNPNLKPEKSHNLNLSVERNGNICNSLLAGSYNITLSGYYNHYDSRITTMDFTGDAEREAGAIYTNEKGVKVKGIDASLRYRALTGVGVSASYNYLHTSGGTIESQFTQPRPHSATWRIDYDKQICKTYRIYVAISGRYLSKPISEYETDGAYYLWKFTLQQSVRRGININFIIDNLFDYRPKVYYWNSAPTIGRTWSVGLSLNINENS